MGLLLEHGTGKIWLFLRLQWVSGSLSNRRGHIANRLERSRKCGLVRGEATHWRVAKNTTRPAAATCPRSHAQPPREHRRARWRADVKPYEVFTSGNMSISRALVVPPVHHLRAHTGNRGSYPHHVTAVLPMHNCDRWRREVNCAETFTRVPCSKPDTAGGQSVEIRAFDGRMSIHPKIAHTHVLCGPVACENQWPHAAHE